MGRDVWVPKQLFQYNMPNCHNRIFLLKPYAVFVKKQQEFAFFARNTLSLQTNVIPIGG